MSVRRRVYVVSHYDLIFFQFRSTLSRALVEALNTFDLVNSDTRIGPLIKVITPRHVHI